jgi:multidrug efflux system outer membrane protein
MKRARAVAAAVTLAGLLHGCASLPEPAKPQVEVPAGWRSPALSSYAITDLPWGTIFRSSELEALLHEALAANTDLAIAAQRVELARAQLGVQRSFLYPQLAGAFAYDRQRLPVTGADENKVYESALLGLSMSTWEIDVWGRLRAAAEGARRQVVVSEETRRAAQTSIVAQVATLYLQILELDAQIDISRRTAQSRRESLRLVDLRYRGGVASKLDLQDATTLVAQADQTTAEGERLLARNENALSLLLGRLPGPIVRARRLQEFDIPAELPAGVPSEILLRRADVRAAEQALYAADSNIEAARKAFYPAITLTGLLGFASPALKDLFDGGRYAWQVSPAVTLPIFTAGRLQSNLEATQAQREIALQTYVATVRGAFAEVNDALSDYQRLSEERQALTTAVVADRERLRLSQLRYRGGVAAYFEVLDSSRQLFQSELQLVQALRAQYAAIVDLYRALGGGAESR